MSCFFSLLIAISYDELKDKKIGYVKRKIKNQPQKKGIAQVVAQQEGDKRTEPAPE